MPAARTTATRPRTSRRRSVLGELTDWPGATHEAVALVFLRLAELRGTMPRNRLRNGQWRAALDDARCRFGGPVFQLNEPDAAPDDNRRRWRQETPSL